MKIFKFGGASIRDAAAIRNVGNILGQYKSESLVIVVSAMGKTTNALEKVVEAYVGGRGGQEELEAVKQAHYQVVMELFEEQEANAVLADLNDTFVGVEWTLDDEPHENYDYNYDQIVSVGELASTKIVAAYLNKINLPTAWLDARDVVQTDDIFREGWVQWPETMARAKQFVPPLLKDQNFVLTQGFIGNTSENFTTTLGREGSDYTAAIFSFCLDAESMTIWKDVPGVLTADPRYFEHVTKLDRLSYKEAIEMTYYGAKVIHPKTIKPLQNKSIPLYVKSFVDPSGEGTYISADVEDNYPPMVAVEREQALLYISTRDFSFVAEHHVNLLFQHITELRLQVNMMQNTAISFNVVFNDVDDKVDRFIERIDKEFKTVLDRGLELITIRHPQKPVVDILREGKLVLAEERLRNTMQMVVKDVPVMRRKES